MSCNLSGDESTSENVTANDVDVDPENPGVMTFENEVFDFGDIASGEKVVHTFKFTNTGKSPLVIFSVKPSCGCTALKGWPKNPIPAGEGGEIAIEFQPKQGQTGNVTKTISIISTANPSKIALKLKGNIKGV